MNHLVLHAVDAQPQQAPKGVTVGMLSPSMTRAATSNPNRQQVTRAGLAGSALCAPAAAVSTSLKVPGASPRQQATAKGIDAPIKEQTTATCCGESKGQSKQMKDNPAFITKRVRCSLHRLMAFLLVPSSVPRSALQGSASLAAQHWGWASLPLFVQSWHDLNSRRT